MYSFDPTEEQTMLVEALNRFASVDLRGKAAEAEEASALPPALIEKGWELGFLQASIPEAYGGFGDRSVVTGALALEEMAWGDLAGALAINAPALFALPILIAGSEAQKQELIPPVIEAEWQTYTAALIEPTFDFDPQALRTSARQEGDEYVLEGEKTFVPFADKALQRPAPGLLVYANLEGQTQGFILPTGAAGLEIVERTWVMGVNALPLYRIQLNAVRLPLDNRLGGPEGHDYTPILDASRVALASMAIGVARAAFEYAREYAKEREVFGVKVAQKQVIAFMLAEMATEIEAMRLLTWEAAWMLDAGKPEAGVQAYLALTGAIDMAMMVTDRAVQILGGHGYIREFPVELWMRNGRGIAALNGLALV